MSIFDHYQSRYEAAKDEEMSLQEFLACVKMTKALMLMQQNAY
ncbi:serine protein kinase [Vibrio sp. JCM 19053]|nr:serine protein kinase [Vibrio sp. JCM 19053]